MQGADGSSVTFSIADDTLRIRYRVPAPAAQGQRRTLFIAIDLADADGSAVLPFAERLEGSTLFLPFRANKFYALQDGENWNKEWRRDWKDWKWSERIDAPEELVVKFEKHDHVIDLPLDELGATGRIKLVLYSKDFTHNSWGRLFGSSDAAALSGEGDKYIPHYHEIDLRASGSPTFTRKARLDCTGGRLRIYQLFVRLFGNSNETRKPNGALSENGVGRFNHINDAALLSLRRMGFNHVWLTGILQQATGTEYSQIGQPADDPDLLKGVAGSPYAIKDYFDVCPDYAENPEDRIAEFKALLTRMHRHELKALIDFVPNHVARSYASDVKPELDFGRGDDRSKFFDPQNNFFYLTPGRGGPPLRLPTMKDGKPIRPTCQAVAAVYDRRDGKEAHGDVGHGPSLQACDGLFELEKKFGRVTGNNVVSWTPGLNDWYETVKLNYGFDFTDQAKKVREYPSALAADKPVPDTWRKMDQVLAYWQEMGVDGFRCDMAHMAPPEFWHWAIARARARRPEVVFIAEAYDNDPAKVPGSDPVVSKLNNGKSNVMFDLLNAGFNAVYDDPTYKAIKKIYDGPGWANDIDGAVSDEFIFDNSLRYAENHDEVRLAAPSQWGGVGMKAGPAVSAILYGLSRGPAMLYNGQEVGEPGAGMEGFGSDDSRTSIFDYWSMPELAKWVNGHACDGGKLSAQQRDLRAFYARLLKVIGEPAFRDGARVPLNPGNAGNEKYGRIHGEQHSGHWLYSFLRYDHDSEQRFLVVVNLHPTETLRDVSILIDRQSLEALGLGSVDLKAPLMFSDRLAVAGPTTATSCLEEASSSGVWIGDIPPLRPLFFDMQL